MKARAIAWAVGTPVVVGAMALALSVIQPSNDTRSPDTPPAPSDAEASTQQLALPPTLEALPSVREASTELPSECAEEEPDDNIIVTGEGPHRPRFPNLPMRRMRSAEKVVRGRVEYVGPERRTSEILTYQEPLEGTQIPPGRDELYCTGYWRTAIIRLEEVLKGDTSVGSSETVHYLTSCSGCHFDGYVSLSPGQELYAFLGTSWVFGDRQAFQGRETGVWPLGTSDGEAVVNPGFRPSGTPPMPLHRFESLVTCVTDPDDDCENYLVPDF